MGFRVFTPAQAKSASEERMAKDAERAFTIASATQDLLRERAEAEKSFEETIKGQQILFEKWFSDNSARKSVLLNEVEELEKRREMALMPPLIKAEDIHSTSEALHARKLELDLRESENEENSRELMRRLDDISSQKQDLDRREKQIKIAEKGIETQRKQVAEGIRSLNRELAAFQSKVEHTETQFAYRNSELDAQKNLYDENDKRLVERENEIEAAKRLIADQRKLLAKGFEELRRKQAKL